jgi:undecaprenyl-diphosphatase
MDYLEAVILGIVEGITEFLPISSTGHLILTASILKIPSTEFLKSFEIAIQLGAILSVVVLYWRSIIFDFNMLKKVILAFIPTAFVGAILYKWIKLYLLGNSHVVLWSLFIGGILIAAFEVYYKTQASAKKSLEVNYKQAFFIGIFQSMAVIPGVSRAAATIIGGLMLGLHRSTIVEFSFLLAIPTMLAATAFDLMKSATSFNLDQFVLLFVGFTVSFFTAILAIKFLIFFIKKHNFIPFAIYRIILALLLFIFAAKLH